MQHRRFHASVPRGMRLAGLAAAAVAAALLTAAAPPAAAQNAAAEKSIERGKSIFMSKGNCAFCHGWAADGRGNERAQVAASSLRMTELDRAGIDEVIRCGRPGTGMPYHDRQAYKDDRCYGMTREADGEDVPPISDKGLQQREINFILDYLEARILGKPEATVAECIEFWGKKNAQCREVERIMELQRTN